MSHRATAKRLDDFMRGRYVGRKLACCALGVSESKTAILPDSRGVPWVEHDDLGLMPYSISLSHTIGVAGAAIIELPFLVGVDVECPISSWRGVVRDYFDEIETGICVTETAAEIPWRVAEIWAQKEAGLKALGVGLSVPTSTVCVSESGTRVSNAWYHAKLGIRGLDRYSGWSLDAWVRRYAGVVLAVAVASRARGAEVSPPDAVMLV
ncbi:MAG: 4'-phosphopantetheinyl transferase superfamily protein [Polyangiaceae bacterium]|nr:4'-phosphopantetheinyl transferase superfamily protein [Polyangiaceae bacterium]